MVNYLVASSALRKLTRMALSCLSFSVRYDSGGGKYAREHVIDVEFIKRCMFRRLVPNTGLATEWYASYVRSPSFSV